MGAPVLPEIANKEPEWLYSSTNVSFSSQDVIMPQICDFFFRYIKPPIPPMIYYSHHSFIYQVKPRKNKNKHCHRKRKLFTCLSLSPKRHMMQLDIDILFCWCEVMHTWQSRSVCPRGWCQNCCCYINILPDAVGFSRHLPGRISGPRGPSSGHVPPAARAHTRDTRLVIWSHFGSVLLSIEKAED